MPAIKVFAFVNQLKDYVHAEHPDWRVTNVVIPYSNRHKENTYGYTVIPLEVRVGAMDSDNKLVKCNISYDQIRDILKLTPSELPYIGVSNDKGNNRKIFDNGFTFLIVECQKVQSYKGFSFYKHYTRNIIPKGDTLYNLDNEVCEKVTELISVQCKNNKHRVISKQIEELLDDEEEYQTDVDAINYGTGKVEGGYKD